MFDRISLSNHLNLLFIIYFLFIFDSKFQRFPFDTKNPIGYLAACILQYIHLAYEIFFISNLVTLAVGAYFFALTAIKDLKDLLRSINDQCAVAKTVEERLQARNLVREFVQVNSALKQLSNTSGLLL